MPLLANRSNWPRPRRARAGPRTRSNNETSAERILLRVADLLAVRGFEQTSIRDTCTLAGLAAPFSTNFFRSKEGLSDAVIKQTCQHFSAQLSAALDSRLSFRDECGHQSADEC